ncbi:MAG: leucine-rich repeat domain-containing protein [Bacteroidales bacterium]|nr:leucine-rich repeat domain-containing protein [Bacteroidales bacterium]
MKNITLLILLLVSSFLVKAQQSLSNKDIVEYEGQVKQMVNYLQETLNFIGDPNNSAQEKDIIFKESYSKIFKDDKVQVEDDLDENRSISINKDIQAYLKDIDFFFHNVKFSFDVQSVTPQINELGNTFFKVAMVRSLSGRTITGDTVVNTRNRFLEINLDEYKKELKIVSFYTTRPNAKEELYTWWNSMSKPWKDYLGKEIFVFDSIEMKDINLILDDAFTVLTKHSVILQDTFMIVDNDTMTMDRIDELYGHRPDTILYIDKTVSRMVNDTIAADLFPIYESLRIMTKITEVDVADNITITDLNPLAELSDLRSLNCSGTNVSDINPIRNLNKIKELDISNTKITDISNLKYANVVQIFKADNNDIKDISVVAFFRDLNNLSLQNTDVYDVKSLEKCVNIRTLNLSSTQVNDLSPLKDLLTLHDLDISNSFVNDLSPLQGLVNLYFLNLEGTPVTDLSPLSNLDRLNVINLSNTKVESLAALIDLPHLNKIYCDNTLITKEDANRYKANKPDVLLINESNALITWWNELPSFWKTLLKDQAMTSINPTKEELHAIINIKSLKVSYFIQDAEPISRLTNIESLDLSDSKIDDLSPLYGLHNLRTLNVRNTAVSDISPLANNNNLRELNIENTNINSLTPLHELKSISKIYADGTNITTEEVVELKKIQRQVSVIYQTDELKLWWGNLDDSWRDIFNSHILCNSNPTSEQLQSIIDLEEIVIEPENVVYTLEPITQMAFLKKLIVNNNQIQDLSPLNDKYFLEELSVSGNPVDNILPLSQLTSLKNLNIENTPIGELTPIEYLENIKVLNISGTSVRNLKPIARFHALEDLSIVNTGIKNVEVLLNLDSLKHLKAYKTKIKGKSIDLLKEKHPDLNVIHY